MMVNLGYVIGVVSVCGLPQSAPADGAVVAVPKDVTQLWAGYDPRALPLDIEIKQEWTEAGAKLQRLYFTSEVSDGVPARFLCHHGRAGRRGQNARHSSHPRWRADRFTRMGGATGRSADTRPSVSRCGEVAGRTDFRSLGR